MDPETEHPSVHPDICGITVNTGRVEWICINKPHNQEYRRKSTDANHQGYTHSTGQHPERAPGVTSAPFEKHYFVNRWPYRPISKENK